jgi:hypothetical protein
MLRVVSVAVVAAAVGVLATQTAFPQGGSTPTTPVMPSPAAAGSEVV